MIFLYAGMFFAETAGAVLTKADVDRATREVNRPIREEIENRLEKIPAAPLIEEDIGDIDLSVVPDGIYIGECPDYMGTQVKVRVTVKDHRILNVKVFGRDNLYVEMAKGVIGKVMEKQSLRVDAVTGATKTSRAILGAIKDALEEDF